jgi:hypothetical protein
MIVGVGVGGGHQKQLAVKDWSNLHICGSGSATLV